MLLLESQVGDGPDDFAVNGKHICKRSIVANSPIDKDLKKDFIVTFVFILCAP